MSAIARVLLARGDCVCGSDRSHDRGETADKFARLKESGVKLFAQDGSGVTDDVDIFVVSSAVEDSIPDVRAAKESGIRIRKRAEILADIINAGSGIAIAGTSGKTTVTGMIGHILKQLDHDPTLINGGEMLNYGSNAVTGKGRYIVAETDESDGSIALFRPAYALLNNIALDHKEMGELRHLFGDFLASAGEGAALNLDNAEAARLAGEVPGRLMGYGIDCEKADLKAENLTLRASGVAFDCIYRDDIIPVRLKVPGKHNVSNALAALAMAALLRLDISESAQALSTFEGIKRRLQVVGNKDGITVIDDFAHNPDKIAASLETLKDSCEGCLYAVFQPHGFGPTKMLRDGLVDVFATYLGEDDMLLMPEIYYAGGSADQSISSEEIIEDVKKAGRQAVFFQTRQGILPYLENRAQSGDVIAVMGARDDTLSEFAAELVRLL